MKKIIAIALAVLMLATAIPVAVSAAAPGIGDGIVDASALTGQHYNLNIIGVNNPKQMKGNTYSGNVIFVNLDGTSQINLVESGTTDAPGTTDDECAVINKNATGSNAGVLALPDPGIDPYVVGGDMTDVDTVTNYSIFVRPLGQPNNYAEITTCADVLNSQLASFLNAQAIHILNKVADTGAYVSIESTGQLLREKKQSVFTNQTAALLTIVLKVDILDSTGAVLDTVYVRVPIFNDMLQNEYWQYDNNGLKLLQVRIYRVGTDVSNYDNPDAWNTIPLP